MTRHICDLRSDISKLFPLVVQKDFPLSPRCKKSKLCLVYGITMKSQVDKKIIGFDMDGVIIDHTARKIALAKSFGFKLNKKETPPEVMKRLIPEPEYRKLQYFLYDHPETALLPSLMPGIKSVLARVKRSGLPYCLISRRQKSKMSQKLLEKHGLWPKYFNEKNTY